VTTSSDFGAGESQLIVEEADADEICMREEVLLQQVGETDHRDVRLLPLCHACWGKKIIDDDGSGNAR
jgi:hypothetical protein